MDKKRKYELEKEYKEVVSYVDPTSGKTITQEVLIKRYSAFKPKE